MKNNKEKDINDTVQLIDEDEVITLISEDNEPVDFNEVAVVEYNSELFALLQPCEKCEGIEDDEVVIFKIEEHENGEDDTFTFVDDDELADAVFEEYLRAATSCDGACEGCPSKEGCAKDQEKKDDKK